DPDDPAEAYHEASKVTPSQIGRQLQGAARLAADRELQLSSMRAVKRQGVAGIPLPAPAPLDCRLGDALQRRRSHRAFDPDPVAVDALTAVLHAGYGVTGVLGADEGQPELRLRAVPSGGALYPLELYVAVLRVAGLDPGLCHVAQNVLLAATALGLAAVPLGAFYDRRTDTFLALDGVNESTLYAIAVGR